MSATTWPRPNCQKPLLQVFHGLISLAEGRFKRERDENRADLLPNDSQMISMRALGSFTPKSNRRYTVCSLRAATSFYQRAARSAHPARAGRSRRTGSQCRLCEMRPSRNVAAPGLMVSGFVGGIIVSRGIDALYGACSIIASPSAFNTDGAFFTCVASGFGVHFEWILRTL
jgi:hypothetical protein